MSRALDAITDLVLAYRPKKKRKRTSKKSSPVSDVVLDFSGEDAPPKKSEKKRK